MIPAEMRGGWIRNGISLDGGDEIEDTVVWWLQAASRHCDLRVPYVGADGVTAFAGTTTWSAPRLTWHPEVELNPSVFEDTGVITWNGADLMESGVRFEAGREISYVERWQRLPGGEGELQAFSTATGRLVRTGSYALSIVDDRSSGAKFAAVAWRLIDDKWSVHHRWPADAVAPPPPPSVPADRNAVVLDDGKEWIIDDC